MLSQAEVTLGMSDTEARGGVSEIMAKKLFLSSRTHAEDSTLLQRLAVTHVLSLTYMDVKKVANVTYKKVMVLDHDSQDLLKHLDEALDFVSKALAKAGGKCLVHCDAGVSRSPTVVIAFLVRHEKMSLDAAYLLVRRKRPVIAPNHGFAHQLIKFQQAEDPKANAMPFRIQYLRSYYGYGKEDSDETIERVLREAEFDFGRTNEILFALVPDRKMSIFAVS